MVQAGNLNIERRDWLSRKKHQQPAKENIGPENGNGPPAMATTTM